MRFVSPGTNRRLPAIRIVFSTRITYKHTFRCQLKNIPQKIWSSQLGGTDKLNAQRNQQPAGRTHQEDQHHQGWGGTQVEVRQKCTEITPLKWIKGWDKQNENYGSTQADPEQVCRSSDSQFQSWSVKNWHLEAVLICLHVRISSNWNAGFRFQVGNSPFWKIVWELFSKGHIYQLLLKAWDQSFLLIAIQFSLPDIIFLVLVLSLCCRTCHVRHIALIVVFQLWTDLLGIRWTTMYLKQALSVSPPELRMAEGILSYALPNFLEAIYVKLC